MSYLSEYPVIVVGGGPGGIMAALASARLGVRTLLIEQGAFLGGTATRSQIGPIAPFHFGDEQIVRGLPQEFIDALVHAGGATGHMKCLNPYGTGVYVCVYDHNTYKYVAQKMLIDAGVDILFHATVTSVMVANNCIEGLTVSSRFGTAQFGTRMAVDATGDGNVAVLAGETFTYGDGKGGAQPASAMFEMAGVDTSRLYTYILEHPDQFGRLNDMVPMRDDVDFGNRRFFVAQGYRDLVMAAKRDGSLIFGRDDVHTTSGFRPGVMHFNSVRISHTDNTDLMVRSRNEIDGREQIESIARFMVRHVPGFENAYVSATSSEVGVRETRHIHGQYILTGDDILAAKRFPDVVARGCFPVDIHGAPPKDPIPPNQPAGAGGFWQELPDAYDIPYRSLVPKTIGGLVLAGRCISSDAIAHSSFRTQGTLMGYSQASGIAAALCATRSVQPRDLPYADVQKRLLETNASPYRDEQAKAREYERARKLAQAYVQKMQPLITPSHCLQEI